MSKSPAFQEGAKELRKARAAGLPLLGAVALFSLIIRARHYARYPHETSVRGTIR